MLDVAGIQWEDQIQFIIIQFRLGVAIALWQVPAFSYRAATIALQEEVVRLDGITAMTDKYEEIGRLNTKYLCPINLDLSKYRPRGFIIGRA